MPGQMDVTTSITADDDERDRQLPGGDYALVREAIGFLTREWEAQPELGALAAHLRLSPTACQKLFKRWCGLSPKEFVQAITIDRARALLNDSTSVFDCSLKVGLSGGARLHDLFVSHEAMTPGDYKRRGAGLTMAYGFHPTPFGEAALVVTERGLAGLAFVNEDEGQTAPDALADLARRWPLATLTAAPEVTAGYVGRVFDRQRGQAAQPVRIVLIGTDFEVRVWQTLLEVPLGRAVSYADLARRIGAPQAMRAVGTAVGRNPISFVVPCHRVLRADGGLGGYHWGLTRKRALIGWEAGQVGAR